MQKKTFKNLDSEVYEETLDNGLRIFISPMERQQTHASLTTLFGAKTLEFKPLGKDEFITLPAGTAHFLEHKMFAKEEGPDPMMEFNTRGAQGNAYTSAHETRYYFNGPTDFEANLKTLLDCITQPYFTEENIKKEQGIIDQEIMAGFDSPDEIGYFASILNTFKEDPYRYPVAGYTQSIKSLTPEILYDCYNTFYHPGNMLLIITGNVDPVKTIELIKKYYENRHYDKLGKIAIKNYNEPPKVLKEKEIIHRDVTNKLLTISYKIPIDNPDLFRFLLVLEIYLDIKTGSVSDFFDTNFNDKNVLGNVQGLADVVGNYCLLQLSSEVLNPDEIILRTDKCLKEKTFTEEEFNLIVKNIIKSVILTTDNIVGIANMINSEVNQYGEVKYDLYDAYKNLKYEECLAEVQNLDFSNRSIVIVEK